MPDVQHLLRIILALQVLIAASQYAALVGPWASARRRPIPLMVAAITMFIGGLGGLLYVFAGQFKAMLLDVPFDVVSWGGLATFVVFNLGSAWWIWWHLHGRK